MSSRTPVAQVTIQDVAQAAGVSTKTVSRVLNREAYVAEATRSRVERVIRKMGYYPHTGAQSLRAHRSDSVGVAFSAPLNLVPISEQLLGYLFSHLYRLFGARGNTVLFDFGSGVTATHEDYARGLWMRRYGAVVVLGPLAENDAVIRRIHESGYPYVTTSRLASLPECSSATVDLAEAAYVSTKHLLDRGHRRVALLSSFEGYMAGDARREGYARALKEAGMEIDERLIRATSFAHRELAGVVHRLLMDHEVTALVDSSACEDAEGIREGARRAGRIVGDSVEVLCWTYTDNAAVMSEACGHVWVPIREALVEGLDELAKWFNGEREGPISVVYSPTLYETQGLEEISKPRPVFDVSR